MLYDWWGGKLSVQLDFQFYTKGRSDQTSLGSDQVSPTCDVFGNLEFMMFVPLSGSDVTASVQSPGLCEEGSCPL